MKERIKVVTGSNEVQWLYSQDWQSHSMFIGYCRNRKDTDK